MRMISLLGAMALLWVVLSEFRPRGEKPVAAEQPKPGEVAREPAKDENLVPGKNDLDAEQVADLKDWLEMVRDRTPLKGREMPAYWTMLRWSRTQKFSELEKRATAEPVFSQLWEEPNKYRGHLYKLRLHVRRVLEYDAPENPIGLKRAYEIWGWTENSKSFPHVVVVPELPPGLKVGADSEGEAVFVGYFLKIMSYTAFDADRGAPLFVGRARTVTPGYGARAQASSSSIGIWELAALGLTAIAVIFGARLWTRRPAPQLAVDESFDSEVPAPAAQSEQRVSHMASADSTSIADPDRWYDLIDASKPDEQAVEHRKL
jgi:hypothetical protein